MSAKPRLKPRLLVAAVTAIGLAVGGRLAFAWSLDHMLAPARHAVGPAPGDLMAESVELRSAAGNTLRGWLISPKVRERPRGIVVLLHGNRADRTAMLGRARWLRTRGFATVLMDLSAHGESDGDTITFGHREKHDARTAVEFARGKFPGLPVVGLGYSLGGAALTLALPDLAVDALILEAVYPDITAAVRNRVFPWAGPINDLLTAAALKRLRAKLALTADDLRPVAKIGAARCPVLLIGGAKDRLTTPKDTARLRKAAPAGSQCWLVPGAGHVDFHGFAPQEYETTVGQFLDEALAAP